MLLLVAPFLACWALYSLAGLVRNIRRAQKIGIPYHIIPASPVNPLWILLEPVIITILDYLPFKIGHVRYYGRRTWQFDDRAQSHLRMGDAWAIVTPSEVFVYICDADAITDIIARRADFVRPVELYKLLDVFGANVATVVGADWQRHRKIVAAPFNENTNGFVWSEALTQAAAMLTSLTQLQSSGTGGLGTDTRTLALNVLAATGFKRSYPFHSSLERRGGHGDGQSYGESLTTVMENSILIMLIPPWMLQLPIWPRWCQRAGQAVETFKQHMLTMFNTEKALLDRGEPGTGTLMSSFVRESSADRTSSKTLLTMNEILGNMYVINFAGHDTTANSLAYTLFLLAAHPEVQDWMGEELRAVFPSADRDTWSYKETYPRLKRCLAVLLETMRLYPPILALPKCVAPESTTLHLPESGRTLTLPQKTFVMPSLLAVQTHPKYWPDEPQTWRPQRWIPRVAGATPTEQLMREEIDEPRTSTYLPWSAGVQVCAGRKFAQVEVVAVLASLFREHRLRVVLQKGEDFERARARILAHTMDTHQLLVMQMRDADSTLFTWERVE
ncbi:putative cytochrome P450 [Aspergillus ellipticus CBS 707.79]|uniref:Putative cytochrome P450 n=1 Tax=Aspergillus ellipticus CBS 707.79 TaxID=1448320 RepID=A0A319DL17_9EURO|nr:putative cytochrome P450 [Aspergillus ellipticus CBS 707.79]